MFLAERSTSSTRGQQIEFSSQLNALNQHHSSVATALLCDVVASHLTLWYSNDQAGAAHAVRIGIHYYCKRMSLANVSANTAYKIIGGYGVDSRSLPNLMKRPNHDEILY